MSDSRSVSYSDEDVQDNGLIIEGPPWGLEKIFDYEAGGHHPVHLNDILYKRYKVIQKLGSGGYANVWLCRDVSALTPKYVATKIIMAEGSTLECPESRVTKLTEVGCGQESASMYLCLPLDKFEIDGPNGTHYAFVYPVLGPRVSRLFHIAKSDDPGSQLRQVCLEATQAMAITHSHGICHGDFRPANILARISGLDNLAEEALIRKLGAPKTTKVMTVSGENHRLESAPRYLVYPVNWDEVLENQIEPKLTTGSACLTDFGESFDMSNPPPEIGIPQVYCAPEQALEQKISKESDLWALGCTLFEIRTGRKLFDIFDDDVDEYLYKVALILGKYPEPWWSTTWELRGQFFEDETDEAGRVVEVHQELHSGNTNSPQRVVVFEKAKSRSLKEAISQGLIYDSNRGPIGLQRSISSRESEVFADLLTKILDYKPEKRLSACDVLEHEWFKFIG